MNEKLINKIKLFDKLASETLIVKEADYEGPSWWSYLPLAPLVPGGVPAAALYGGYKAYQAIKGDQEKGDPEVKKIGGPKTPGELGYWKPGKEPNTIVWVSTNTKKLKKSDYTEEEISQQDRANAESQAKTYADVVIKDITSAYKTDPEKAKRALKTIMNKACSDANNFNISIPDRYKNLRICQKLSNFSKTLK